MSSRSFTRRKRLSPCVQAILCGCLPFVATQANAQDSAQSPVLGSAAEKPTLDLGIEVSAGYSDNLFATRKHEAGDFLLILQPSARFSLVDGPNRLILRGEGEIGRHDDFTSEDYDDWLLGGDGRLEVAPNLGLLGGGEYQWEHESRASPDAENGLEPTDYERLYLYAGAIAKSGKLTIRPALQFNRYDFDDVAAAGAPINNDDRDRSQFELGARLAYRVADGTDLFLQGSLDRREYDQRVDDFGFRRDSQGGSVVAGIRRTFSPRLNAEFFAGYLGQDFDEPRFDSVGTFDVGALVNWTAPSGLAATFRLDRSIEETTLPEASSYVLTSGSLGLSATPHPRVRAGLTLAGSKYDYRGGSRSEFVTSGELWLRYWLNPHLYAGLNYGLSQRTSNAAGFDYDENRLMLRVGAELRPRYSKDAEAIDFAGTLPGGPYAGLFGAHGTLVTGLDGPRGQGSNTADFGDSGFAGGVMLGYGATAGDLYFGAEIEGALGGPKWLHVADRVFSVRKEDGVGVAVRVGWVTPMRDLVYGRAGLTGANLRTKYLHSESIFDESERETGFSFGVGAEAARRGFVRAEYVLTSYKDRNVPTGNDRFDNFSTGEGQFRLGAGLRFGAPAAHPGEGPAPTRFGGPYLGFQVGHGSLLSRNRGARSGGTPIDIQRGGMGPLGGIFAGWGATWRQLYFGAEAEANVSGIDWNIERDPNGRIYSAQLQHALAASARIGWLISPSAMLYARMGPARARFRVPYATSGDSVLSKRTRGALQVGGGLELGAGDRTRLRIEYATADYGAYDVEYGESNSDQFDHRHTMVRAGVAWSM